MAQEPRVGTRSRVLEDIWPPDDTEESILGSDLHQTTITNLRLGLHEAAVSELPADAPARWRALTQITLLGCRRPDGSAYRTYPDIFVFPHPVDLERTSFSVQHDGPPVLIIEVLSESTYAADLDVLRGKGYSYGQAGVREYLTMDPLRRFLPEGICAWRLRDGLYTPWLPETTGRWRSEVIGVEFGLDGIWSTVHTYDGDRMLREFEVGHVRATLRDERERFSEERHRWREEVASRDAELQQLRQRLAERG